MWLTFSYRLRTREKDRLIAYYAWNNDRSLEQALLVAINNYVDIDDSRSWSEQ